MPSTNPSKSALVLCPDTMKHVDTTRMPTARNRLSRLQLPTLMRACSSDALRSYQPEASSAAAASASDASGNAGAQTCSTVTKTGTPTADAAANRTKIVAKRFGKSSSVPPATNRSAATRSHVYAIALTKSVVLTTSAKRPIEAGSRSRV